VYLQDSATGRSIIAHRFSRLASVAAAAMGHWLAFVAALVVTPVWMAVGPFFHFSNGWNFAANSSTTVLTFLAVFLLQHSQNRDTAALHLKLDAIILALEDVDNDLAGIERQDDARLQEKAAGLASSQQAFATGG
jgi:low affinity Fe/Cu permease